MRELIGLWSRLAWLLLIVLAASAGLRLLTGRIPLHGLLTGTTRDGRAFFSPGRAQMLLVSLFAAIAYAIEAFTAPGARLPDVPAPLLGGVAVSHLIYLAGKARSLSEGGRR